MKNPDYELWHALHDSCPLEGCGACVGIDLEWTDEEFAEIATAAAAAGETVGVYIHKAVVLGMQYES